MEMWFILLIPSAESRSRGKVIAVTRSGGERPFATDKRRYGLARTRFLGLAKHTTVYRLAAMMANIREGAVFLTRYVPKPCYAGEPPGRGAEAL